MGGAGDVIRYRKEIKWRKKLLKKTKKRNPAFHKDLKKKINRWKKEEKGWQGIF